MTYNGVTEHLHRLCLERREAFYRQNQEERACTGRSLFFVKRFFYDEMAYKLLMLVDGEFESFGSWREKVRSLVPMRKSYVLEHLPDPEARELLRQAEREFLEFLEGVKETDTAPMECYARVIHGEERELLEYAILEKWDYCANYWYPLKGAADESKLFLNTEYLEVYWDRLCALLGLPEQRVYEYGESYYEDGQLMEVDALDGYGGNECAYLPKDLSWVIYFSHEETVTFAGTILPMVRELLKEEREHWNKWD